jgi:hypothetical protein
MMPLPRIEECDQRIPANRWRPWPGDRQCSAGRLQGLLRVGKQARIIDHGARPLARCDLRFNQVLQPQQAGVPGSNAITNGQ